MAAGAPTAERTTLLGVLYDEVLLPQRRGLIMVCASARMQVCREYCEDLSGKLGETFVLQTHMGQLQEHLLRCRAVSAP